MLFDREKRNLVVDPRRVPKPDDTVVYTTLTEGEPISCQRIMCVINALLLAVGGTMLLFWLIDTDSTTTYDNTTTHTHSTTTYRKDTDTT